MLGVYLNGYGDTDVLEIKEDIEVPKITQDDQVKVEIKYSGFNHLDTKLRKGYMSQMNVKILGIEYSGVITEMGSGVKDLKVGDKVFGFSLPKMSTYAKYLVIPSAQVRKIPDGLSFEEASIYPCSVLTVWQNIKQLWGQKMNEPSTYEKSKEMLKDKTVVLVGCSGPLGVTAFLIVKHVLGCTKTIGICSSKNHEGMKKLGCDVLFDYKQKDYLDNVFEHKPDFVIDLFGGYSNLEAFSTKMKDHPNVVYTTPGVPDGVSPREFMGKIAEKKNCFFVGHKNNPDELAFVVGTVFKNFDCWGKTPFTTYDLKEVKQCHKDYVSKRPMGKMILKI